MADYTLPIFIVTAYVFNFVLLYRKNRFIHNLLFMCIGFVLLYNTHTNSTLYGGIALFMIVLGFLALIYDLFGVTHNTKAPQ